MSKIFVPLVTRFAFCLDFSTRAEIFRDRVVLFVRMHDSLGAAFGEVVIMNLTLTFYEKERDLTRSRSFWKTLARFKYSNMTEKSREMHLFCKKPSDYSDSHNEVNETNTNYTCKGLCQLLSI